MSENDSPAGKGPELYSVGTVVAGKYGVLEVLGEGSLGVVYKVEIVSGMVGEALAMKVLPAEFSEDESRRDRFLDEIRVAMKLVDRHIIQIRDVGTAQDGRLFYTMDYSPGMPLDRVLAKEGRLSIPRTLQLVSRVLKGLSAAHRQGVSHCDLTPADILVEKQANSEIVRILDFGLATAVGTSTNVEGGGGGRALAYRAPEQLQDGDLGAHTDIYAVGCVFYRCLTGQSPYHGKSSELLLQDMLSRPPVSPESLNPQIGSFPGLSDLVLRALERDPENRFQSAKDFFGALKAVVESVRGNKPAASASPRARRGGAATVSRRPSVPPVAGAPKSSRGASPAASRRVQRKTGVPMAVLVGGPLAIVALVVLVVVLQQDPGGGPVTREGAPTAAEVYAKVAAVFRQAESDPSLYQRVIREIKDWEKLGQKRDRHLTELLAEATFLADPPRNRVTALKLLIEIPPAESSPATTAVRQLLGREFDCDDNYFSRLLQLAGRGPERSDRVVQHFLDRHATECESLKKAWQTFSDARNALEAADYQRAIRLLDEVLESEIDAKGVEFFLAEAHFLSDPDRKRPRALELLARLPQDEQTVAYVAVQELLAKEYQYDAEWRARIGRVRDGPAKADKVVRFFVEKLDREPAHIAWQAEQAASQATEHFQALRFPEAIPLFERAIELGHKDVNLPLLHAEAVFLTDPKTKSEASIELLRALDPANQTGRAKLVRELLEGGLTVDSEVLTRIAAAAEGPHADDAVVKYFASHGDRVGQALEFYREGNHEEAVPLLRALYDATTDSAIGYKLADSCFRSGVHDGCRQVVDEQLQILELTSLSGIEFQILAARLQLLLGELSGDADSEALQTARGVLEDDLSVLDRRVDLSHIPDDRDIDRLRAWRYCLRGRLGALTNDATELRDWTRKWENLRFTMPELDYVVSYSWYILARQQRGDEARQTFEKCVARFGGYVNDNKPEDVDPLGYYFLGASYLELHGLTGRTYFCTEAWNNVLRAQRKGAQHSDLAATLEKARACRRR